jgi:hypothetical protein
MNDQIEDSQLIFCLASICNILWKNGSFIDIVKNNSKIQNVLELGIDEKASLQSSMAAYLLSFFDDFEKKELVMSNLRKWKQIDENPMIAEKVEERIRVLSEKINSC